MSLNRVNELEQFLRTTHADQGGEATFEVWLLANWNQDEYGFDERKEFLVSCGQGGYGLSL